MTAWPKWRTVAGVLLGIMVVGAVGAQAAVGPIDKRTVVVDPSWCGADYSDPVAALAGVGTGWCVVAPSVADRCTISVNPGTYDIGAGTLQLVPWVDIEGTDQQSTVIRGSNATTAGVVRGIANAELRTITVENTGGGAYAVGISAESNTLNLKRVTAKAAGGTSFNWAINLHKATAVLDKVHAIAAGGPEAIGIRAYKVPSLATDDVTATVSGATARNIGLSVNDGSAAAGWSLDHISVLVSGGAEAYGAILGNMSGTLKHFKAVVSGAASNCGVHVSGGVATLEGADLLVSGATRNMGISTYAQANLTVTTSMVTATGGVGPDYAVQSHNGSSVTLDRSALDGGWSSVLTRNCSTTTLTGSMVKTGLVDAVEDWTGAACIPPAATTCSNSFRDGCFALNCRTVLSGAACVENSECGSNQCVAGSCI